MTNFDIGGAIHSRGHPDLYVILVSDKEGSLDQGLRRIR
jgi:hypothetical protein